MRQGQRDSMDYMDRMDYMDSNKAFTKRFVAA